MRWAEHVARMEERRSATEFLWGDLRERDHLENPGLRGRIIVRWIFKEVGCGGMDWIDLAQNRVR